MDSPSRELALHINGHMADQGAPLDDSQFGALELALESLKPRRELVHKHVLADDSEPDRYRLSMNYLRTETAEEHADRMATMQLRLAVLTWRPEQGPPPSGIGFSRLCEQKTWWAPKSGDPIKIADMDDGYRRNLIAYLERAAPVLKLNYEYSLLRSFPSAPSDGVAASIEQMQNELEQTTALDWLNRQPLVKALRKLDKKARKNERADA